jgi:hypothetical protein
VPKIVALAQPRAQVLPIQSLEVAEQVEATEMTGVGGSGVGFDGRRRIVAIDVMASITERCYSYLRRIECQRSVELVGHLVVMQCAQLHLSSGVTQLLQ